MFACFCSKIQYLWFIFFFIIFIFQTLTSIVYKDTYLPEFYYIYNVNCCLICFINYYIYFFMLNKNKYKKKLTIVLNNKRAARAESFIYASNNKY